MISEVMAAEVSAVINYILKYIKMEIYQYYHLCFVLHELNAALVNILRDFFNF